jgi:DNA-binding IclR family transcriptional regulator
MKRKKAAQRPLKKQRNNEIDVSAVDQLASSNPSPKVSVDRAQSRARQKNAAGSQTVDRAMSLLKLIARSPSEGLRLLDLSGASGFDRATTYRLVSSLVKHGLVDQEESTKRYTLGLEFFTLAAAASNRHDLSNQARIALEYLSEVTGDTAIFCLRSNSNIVCVDVQTGSFPVKALPMDIGSHRPIGAGASGVAILAPLPDFEVRQMLQSNRQRLKKIPGQDLDAILNRVANCRKQGYAFAAEEPEGRILGLAVALVSRNNRPLGTLTLCGIPERFTPERVSSLAKLLMERSTILDETLKKIRNAERLVGRLPVSERAAEWF